eukprot:Blabericola_migrator_1__12075@NODE_743_length_6671_cov_113_057692_g533_i0_p1_GENE_NODE_743_length_6671_cov_113_057692_g533_i0NODE_743_length_6671_cov_113_057692_g533_i0_p1_ORF_typecomplete_len365_score86_00ANAPC3/PF12895_7/0_00023ChAPs/PF09295_10/0_023DUF627/PF04781_12/0_21DUF627/PF04781_12/7_6e02DUF4919/PF16266_5/0_11BTAD/PF03704_17/0_15BTAD/PF03704_17/2_8e03TPR_19/PF14559_6/1_4TPR_16/PF13432_6/1_9e02TPR_16/PF13432_6/0_91TPR_16/PF13432_6/11TPR_11/PF13414_6/9_4e02TPR_11/PF13414_6/3_4TPR_11/PF134
MALPEETASLFREAGLDPSTFFSDVWDKRPYEVHPLFRDTAPTEEEVKEDPLFAALAATRDEGDDESSFEERLTYWKNLGNTHHKEAALDQATLDDAIKAYSNGLLIGKDAPGCQKLRAQLLINRANCLYKKRAFNECLRDAKLAVSEDPQNPKGYYFAIRASLAMGLSEKAHEWVTAGDAICKALTEDSSFQPLRNLVKAKADESRARRESAKAKEASEKGSLIQALKLNRRFSYCQDRLPFPSAPLERPVLVEEGVVAWPIVFIVCNTIELMKEWDERLSLRPALELMFPKGGPHAAWDEAKEYECDRLTVYHTPDDAQEAFSGKVRERVDIDTPLRAVLDDINVLNTYPCFIIKLKRQEHI